MLQDSIPLSGRTLEDAPGRPPPTAPVIRPPVGPVDRRVAGTIRWRGWEYIYPVEGVPNMCEFVSPFPEWAGFAMASVGVTGPEAPHPEELAALPAASNALRRTTFALGRAAARRAMKALGHPQKPVLAGPDRAPVWPAGLIGSITHTNAHAAAAVAPAEYAGGLGLDLEPAEGDGSLDLARLVAGPAERDWIRDSPARLICLFSAKEAIYKAFYPRHQAFFDFDAVHLDPEPGGFVATLRIVLADWSPGSRCRVRCQVRNGHVLSSVVLPVQPPQPAPVLHR